MCGVKSIVVSLTYQKAERHHKQKFKIMSINITNANGTEYKSTTAKALGNTFSFLVAFGKSNYISVRKVTNNPFKSLGKEFATWDAVEAHYTSADMQIAILSAKSLLN